MSVAHIHLGVGSNPTLTPPLTKAIPSDGLFLIEKCVKLCYIQSKLNMNKQQRLIKYLQEHPEAQEIFDRYLVKSDLKSINDDGVELEDTITTVVKSNLTPEEYVIRIENGKQQFKEHRQKVALGRATELFELYKSGMTLDKVGQVAGITRERVRQIITQFFPDEVKVIAYAHIHKNPVTREVELICKQCGEKFIHIRKTLRHNSIVKYCSLECKRKSQRYLIEYPEWVGTRAIRSDNFTKEEWKIINNLRCNSYYQRNKVVRAAKARAKYHKTDPEVRSVYQKRWHERMQYGHAITPIPNPKRPEVTKD